MAAVCEREGERAQVEKVAAKAERRVGATVAAVVRDPVVDVWVASLGESDESALAVDRLDHDSGAVAILQPSTTLGLVVPEHERVAAAIGVACCAESDREPGEIEGEVEADHPGASLVGAAPEHPLNEHTARHQLQTVLAGVIDEDRVAGPVALFELVVVEQTLLDQFQLERVWAEGAVLIRAKRQLLPGISRRLAVEDQHTLRERPLLGRVFARGGSSSFRRQGRFSVCAHGDGEVLAHRLDPPGSSPSRLAASAASSSAQTRVAVPAARRTRPGLRSTASSRSRKGTIIVVVEIWTRSTFRLGQPR